jgi:hypothetical protein
MRDPYRVTVFGPGLMGGVGIWEVNRLPEFELAGVRAYSDAKSGKDAGELIGIDPIGVTATTDVDALLQTPCDCVLYCARDMGNWNTDDEILQILAAGIDVVTPLPYHNARLWREAEFVERLDAACARGGSTFHATGTQPDLVTERVVLSLLGINTDVKQVTVRETWAAGGLDPALLPLVGFGRPPESLEGDVMAEGLSTNILRSMGRSAESALGVTYARVEEQHDFVATDRDVRAGGFEAKAGTVGRVAHRFSGWLDAQDEQPFFTLELNWYLADLLPPGVGHRDHWIVEIEGTPSARMVIDLRPSLANDDKIYKIGNLKSDPGYHAAIAACLQAIPIVCNAPAGVLPSLEPPLHWKRDLRA